MITLFSARTDVGRVREQNEDNFLVDRKLQLYVVCDGMGGHQCGEVASATAVNVVRQSVLDHQDLLEAYARGGGAIVEQDIEALLKQSVQHASNQIYERGVRNPEQRGMGTTCSLMLLLGDRAFIAHVGDSRIYRWRERRAEQLTEDHSLYNAMVQSGADMGEMSMAKNMKNAVTRAVGVQQSVEVDTLAVPVAPGDRYLLCSDGLSGYLEDGDLDRLLSREDIHESAAHMIELANGRGGNDNITAVVVQLPGRAAAEAEATRAEVPQAWDDALRRSWLARDMSDRERGALARRMELREVAAGKLLASPGDAATDLFFVLEGSLALSGPDGARRLIGAGDAVGDLSLLAGGTHPVGIGAPQGGEARVLALSRDAVSRLTIEQPTLLARLLSNIGRRVSHRFISAVEVLGQPLWRYTNATAEPDALGDTGELQVRIRSGGHTQELDTLEIIEATPDEVPAPPVGPPPPPLPPTMGGDDEPGFAAARDDTLPQTDIGPGEFEAGFGESTGDAIDEFSLNPPPASKSKGRKS